MSLGVKLEPIANILNKEFFIRSYQRGYRWDDDQVNDLLNDFKEFINQPNKSEDEFYCLQPIVVKCLSEKEKEKLNRFVFGEKTIYEVVDGQQRITTITILLQYLKESLNDEIQLQHLPSISYEVREKSKEILSNFCEYISSHEKQIELENNIDFYHMKEVYNTISKWFEKEEQKYRILFLKLLTSYKINSVKVIWYEVEEADKSIEVFRRFNVGKIPLTNAELIKALFLRDNENVDKSVKYSISKEWQQIENQLQSKFLWGFLKPSKKYISRIDYVFDLIFLKERNKLNESERKNFDSFYGTDKHRVFRYFEKEITKNLASLIAVWDQINEVYEKLLQWYNHPEHYHYIGYLQNKEGQKDNIVLKNISQNFKTKQDLTESLIRAIANDSSVFFNDKKIALNYDSDKRLLRNFFFLFNVETYIQLSKSSKGEEIYRLPFSLYNTVDYDIEHVDSKTEKEISSLNKEAKIDFLKDLEIDFGFELGKPFDKNIAPLFRELNIENKWNESNIYAEELDKILESTIEIINNFLEKETDKLDDINKNTIGNLTILNDSINRSYGNSYFNTKRRLIITKDTEGVYIPIATKNVFLKYYSGNTKKHTRWSKSDTENYQLELEKSLSKFIK